MQPIREAIEMQPGCSSRWVRWRAAEPEWYWHHHAEAEISVVRSGRGICHVGDHQAPFRPGQAILLGPDLPHGWRAGSGSAGWDLIALQFRPADLLRRFAGAPEAAQLEPILRASGRGLILEGAAGRDVGAMLARGEATTGLERLSVLLAALVPFATVVDRPLASPRWHHESSEQHPTVAALLSWMSEHAHEEIGLAEAAAFAGMNPSACGRLFRRYTAHSVVGWLNHLRAGRACDLLRDTDRRIADIAFATGFGTLASFNRVFRTLIGQTPRIYRAMYRDPQMR